MNELEEALQRARTELDETNAAIKLARGELVDELAAQLASLQAETGTLDAEVEALEPEVKTLREREQQSLAKLAESK